MPRCASVSGSHLGRVRIAVVPTVASASACRRVVVLEIRGVEHEDQDWDALYPLVGRTVDGRKVGDHVANRGSIGSSLTDYEVLRGIREVRTSFFEDWSTVPPDRTRQVLDLAEQIRENNRVDPLIVVVDKLGPYILEGGHRYDALKILDAEALPALVVIDNE